jgi:transcriptional antiterminator
MTINKRKKEILSLLVQADIYISIESLTKELGITRSTVYRDIKGINDWLERLHLQPIQHARQKGFYLNFAEMASIRKNLDDLHWTVNTSFQRQSEEPG